MKVYYGNTMFTVYTWILRLRQFLTFKITIMVGKARRLTMDQFLIDRMVLQICPALNDPGSHRDQRRHPRGWVFLSTDVKKRKYLQKGANDKCSKLV